MMGSNFHKTLLISIAVMFVSTSVFAQMSARDVVQKMLDVDDGQSRYSSSVLMSCAYELVKNKPKCSSKPRTKVSESLSKDVGNQLEDTLNLNLILQPSSEKGMAFLQKDYDDEEKDSEQWMYMPALKKLKRIVSETDDGPKTGTLFGSEIAYEDIEKRHINDSTYEMLDANASYGRFQTWKIKSVPTASYARKTSYSHSIMWVDKNHYLPHRIDLYDRQGALSKTIYQQRIEQVDGIWVAKQMLIINHSNSRMSMMQIKKMAMNVEVADDLLGVRALDDSNYRESMMKSIRTKAK
jgi:Fe-S cluster biosynthesis and repair protein YggX